MQQPLVSSVVNAIVWWARYAHSVYSPLVGYSVQPGPGWYTERIDAGTLSRTKGARSVPASARNTA